MLCWHGSIFFLFKVMSLRENSNCMQSCNESLSCIKVNNCRGCGHDIYDQYFLMVSQDCWHIHCLKCSDCQVELETELTCFIKDALVLCRMDYYKYGRFSTFWSNWCRKALGRAVKKMAVPDSSLIVIRGGSAGVVAPTAPTAPQKHLSIVKLHGQIFIEISKKSGNLYAL